jgi:hypothetical protein
MTIHSMKKSHIALGIVLAALGFAPAAQAQLNFHVSVDTSTLAGIAAGPYSIDFQLNQGDGTVANSVTIGNFWYSGGHAVGSPTLTGDASGSLGSGFSIANTSFFNEAFQEFVPGSSLSFDVTLSLNHQPTTPDSFVISILDGTLANIPTTGIGDSLLQADIDSHLTFKDFHSGVGTGLYSKVTLVTTPEPTTTGVAVAAALGAAALVIRRHRRA